jgi:hypothetical protein
MQPDVTPRADCSCPGSLLRHYASAVVNSGDGEARPWRQRGQAGYSSRPWSRLIWSSAGGVSPGGTPPPGSRPVILLCRGSGLADAAGSAACPPLVSGRVEFSAGAVPRRASEFAGSLWLVLMPAPFLLLSCDFSGLFVSMLIILESSRPQPPRRHGARERTDGHR